MNRILGRLVALKSAWEVAAWVGLLVTAAIAWLASYWEAADTTVTYSARGVLGVVLGILAGIALAVWRITRDAKLLSQAAAKSLEQQREIAELKKPKNNRVSGDLTVDGIVWSYVGDLDTGEWIRCEPHCPACKTRLCVEDASGPFALEDRDYRTRYHCDAPRCGQVDKTFIGCPETIENKACRHILAATGH